MKVPPNASLCPGFKRPPHESASFHIYKYSGKRRKLCRDCQNAQRRAWTAGQGKAARVHAGKLHRPPPPDPNTPTWQESATARPVGLRPYATVVAIGDLHFPFHHPYALEQAHQIIKDVNPDYVVQMADLYDLYSFSRYPRSLNLMTPQDELMAGRACAETFWSRVRRDAPNATCYQLWGNHDSRAQKRTLERLPEVEGWVARGMKDMMTFDGVTTTEGHPDELEIDGVTYTHSYLAHVGDTMRALNRPCVTGHLHVGGVVYQGFEDEIIWELGAGWLGNRRAPVFTYASRRRSHRTTLGVGLIDPEGPRFIPFFGLPEGSR